MIDRDLMIGALTTDGIVPATITRSKADELSDEQLYKLFLKLEQQERRTSGDDPYEGQKESYGRLATFAWIGSALYLYITSSFTSLFSIQAAIFIIVGMFVAAIVFGWLGYCIQRLIAKGFVALFPSGPNGGAAKVIVLLGLLLMLAEIALIFSCAKWIFVAINGS